jgi:hypothetical protein
MSLSKKSSLTAGRALLSLVGIIISAGCFIADWNETHMFNPRWPGHAKFHGAQTLSMGLVLGLLTQYYTWRFVIDPSSDRVSLDDTWTAALIGSVYYVTGLSAILYPGTTFIDPEFVDGHPHPQIYIFGSQLVLIWLGWFLERRRVLAMTVVGKKSA